MSFWEIYEIFRTGFTRNTRECRLLQLVVAGKCFNQKMFFKKYLIRFDIEWHVLPRIKCITEVWRLFMMFILVCTWFVWFTSLRVLFIWTSGNVTGIVSITHIFFLNKKFRGGWSRVVVLERINVHETVGRKNNSKLNFFSMYFVRNNKEIYLSFRDSEK